MYPERAVVAAILLAVAAGCIWGAVRALRGPATTTAQGFVGAAAILAALFFGAWAVNLLSA